VVLSACGAGRAVGRAAGGAAGFARALRRLGAGAVVAPVVSVGDEMSVDPMVSFHECLRRGETVEASLAAIRSMDAAHPLRARTAQVFVGFR
jgi:CHAT domain-containing protein